MTHVLGAKINGMKKFDKLALAKVIYDATQLSSGARSSERNGWSGSRDEPRARDSFAHD
jgi:hypothetical protein